MPERPDAPVKNATWSALAWLLAVVAVLGVGFGGRYLVMEQQAAGTGQGEVPIGGPFTLVSETGETVTEATFAGRYMVIYFGYTYCPDVCPTTLSQVAAALDLLRAEERAQLAPLFISVDPERDTADVVRQYADAFHPDMVGLTGSPEQVDAIKDTYRVYAAKVDEDGRPATAETGDDYLVDHSSAVYVMAPDGRFETFFSHGTSADTMAGRLRDLLAAARS